MAEVLALEVMAGPMDGLKKNLTPPGDTIGIGRQVGNAMALALDKSVSRWHARAAVEGHAWCLEDQDSTGGIWVSGTKSRKFSLESEQVILLGSTIIEVFTPDLYGVDVDIGDDCFKDPRTVYRMSAGLKEAWDKLYRKAEKLRYCTISGLLRELFSLGDGAMGEYDSVRKLSSPDSWKCLGSWLAEVRAKPFYNLGAKGEVLVAPRLWHIMDMASNGNSRVIDRHHLLRAVIDEKRSIPARYLCRERRFLEDFGLAPVCTETPGFSIIQTGDKDRGKQGAAKRPGFSSGKRDDASFLLQRLKRFERIILGFAEDAACSGMTKRDFRLPGMEHTLEELWENSDDNAVQEYCDTLESYLIGLLAAHRDAVRDFETEIGHRIRHTLDTHSRNSIGKFLVREAVENIAVSVVSVLKEAELGGLSEQIVRERINKIAEHNEEDHDE